MKKKNMIVPALVITTIGVIGVCSSKKVKECVNNHRERCVVKRFVKDYITEDKEMCHCVNRLSDKQIDFLYRLISKLGDIKAGVHLTGEALDEARQKVIDDVNEFIVSHVKTS